MSKPAFKTVYHTACHLERSKNPLERRFAVLLHRVSHAMHDLEMGENPQEAILSALQMAPPPKTNTPTLADLTAIV